MIETLEDGKEGFAKGAEKLAGTSSPELAETFRRTFLAGRRAAAREIIRRGIAKGEFPADTDVELLADAGPALIWHRLTVTGDPLEDDLPERILRQFAPIP